MLRADAVVAGRYRLVDRVARGGMGSVWEAWDERLHRTVALKKLDPQPGLSDSDAEAVRERAMREARITARLHHPNAVPVYDVVDDDGQPCLVMQYLPSRSLAVALRERGSLPVSEVARLGAEIASALAAAHAVGIVHRDVKPGNVLIDENGTAKITDFGISHALGDVTLTSTGMVTGTPAFLAPEVARGDRSTPASDVFSLGATLYATAEGVPPFGAGDNPMATLHRVASGDMDPPRRAGPLTPLLLRMLSRDPSQRPAMNEVGRELGRLRRRLDAGDATTEVTPRGPIAGSDGRPVAIPPSTTLTLPPASAAAARPPAPPPRGRPPVRPAAPPAAAAPTPAAAAPPPRRRRWLLAAVVAVVVLGGLIAGIALATTGSDSPRHPLAGRTTSPGTGAGSHAKARSSHATSRAASRTSSKHSSSPPSPTERSTPPSSTPPSTEASSTAPAGGGAPTAGELASAIENYYALLPGDTNDAWPRQTAAYQQNTAHGRGNYDSFWSQFSSVSTSDVVADPPHTVTATITYTRKNGTTSTERTQFGLVRQGGELKINSSEVIG